MDGQEAYLDSLINDVQYRTWGTKYSPISAQEKSSAGLERADVPPEFARQVGFWEDRRTAQADPGPESCGGAEAKPPDGGLFTQGTGRLPALEALQEYASEHVLLVGRPGSGKTTVLRKVLLEQAKGAKEKPSERVPVLVELKFLTGSMEERIRKFLEEHNWKGTPEEIERCLEDGQFLLLFDGLNEIPPAIKPSAIEDFRRQYRKTTPMIFTSRDIGTGYAVEVEKRFQLLPLDRTDVEIFVGKYLPTDKALSLLAALDRGRLRDLTEIPMFLQMLCARFAVEQDLPPNPALLFRDYLRDFYPQELKYGIQVESGAKFDWYDQAAHIAFNMLEGPSSKGWWRTISVAQAEEMLEQLFRQRGSADPAETASTRLKELLDHYVIQLSREGEIGFPHDLIQEFFAAEYLWKIWGRSDEDTRKRKYLNYLKWTEPLCLLMGLVANGDEAVSLVKSALEVDVALAARLAGSAHPQLQPKTVQALHVKDYHEVSQLEVLGHTRSVAALPTVAARLEHLDPEVRRMAVRTLGALSPERALPLLEKTLQDPDPEVRRDAVTGLGHTRLAAALPLMEGAMHDDEESVRFTAVVGLGFIGEAALPLLEKALQDKEWWFRFAGTVALAMIGTPVVLPLLEKTFRDEDGHVRAAGAAQFGRIGREGALGVTARALHDQDCKVRQAAVCALGGIGTKAVLSLLEEALDDEDRMVRGLASHALGDIRPGLALPLIEKALRHEDPVVRAAAADALGNIDPEAGFSMLEKALQDGDSRVRWAAAKALMRGNEVALWSLLKVMGGQSADFPSVPNALREATPAERVKFVEDWIAGLIPVARLRLAGISALDPARGFKVPIDQVLLDALNAGEMFTDMNPDCYRGLAKVDDPRVIDILRSRWRSIGDSDCWHAMRAIQSRCGFYNLDFAKHDRRIPRKETFYLLHLSDLHFFEKDQGVRWFRYLVQDLEGRDLQLRDRGIDALVISGDVVFRSAEAGYTEARVFIDNLKERYHVNPEHIVLVPGNHDVSHTTSKHAYQPKRREDAQEDLNRLRCIERGDLVEVPIEERQKGRFEHFRKLCEAVTGEPYPTEYEDQSRVAIFDDWNLLILGLNSSWKIDHWFTEAAEINDDALSAALMKIHDDYTEWKKIAVWHHPLISPEESRIKDHAFLGRMVMDGFRMVLHGHIHQFNNDYSFRYQVPTGTNNLEAIAAGTFGAPPQELRPTHPWEYNLIMITGNTMRVNTRMRTSLSGPWERHARWPDLSGRGNLWYYEFDF